MTPTSPTSDRRQFLKYGTAAAAASFFTTACGDKTPDTADSGAEDRFKISLAQWSLNKELKAGTLDNLDFASHSKTAYGIDAVEYVNQFFGEMKGPLGLQPKSDDYISQMKQRAADAGVKNVLIMCDRVGNLGDPDDEKRKNAVEGHHAWIAVAKELGCHSIRVNARSNDQLSPEQQHDLCVDGLGRLAEYAAPHGLNVIVENHGGLSSSGKWLADVLETVGRDNCGSLPDFGNFYLARNRGDADKYAAEKALYEGDPAYQEDETGLFYDRYQGVRDLMPFAKGVSAKSHDFDALGKDVNTDFNRMMKIVAESGFSGYVGIEYEGKTTPTDAGILATKTLLKRSFAEVA